LLVDVVLEVVNCMLLVDRNLKAVDSHTHYFT